MCQAPTSHIITTHNMAASPPQLHRCRHAHQCLRRLCDDLRVPRPTCSDKHPVIRSGLAPGIRQPSHPGVCVCVGGGGGEREEGRKSTLTSRSALTFQMSSFPRPSTQANKAGWTGDHSTSYT